MNILFLFQFLYFQEPLDMEPEEPITPSSGPPTQVSSTNGATASAGSQVKWKKEVLSDTEVEGENEKRQTPKGQFCMIVKFVMLLMLKMVLCYRAFFFIQNSENWNLN